MGKSNRARRNAPAPEAHLVLPPHLALAPALAALPAGYAPPLVDTHTHLAGLHDFYTRAYPAGAHAGQSAFDLVRTLYARHGVQAVVDVWCEAPVLPEWRAFADGALEGRWGDLQYWFVMGVHPHNAAEYDDAVEATILDAMAHPRCVGWGEIGLDYHYDNSPRDIQQTVFARQLQHAIRLGKPLTIHTREAEADTERILKETVPQDWKIHVHCFTDSPDFAQRLLDHFPNLYIGITGVITYTTNPNTAAVVRALASSPSSTSAHAGLRILLETDAPYMIPSTLYADLPGPGKLPLSHAGMIPWTAACVAEVAEAARTAGTGGEGDDGEAWSVLRVLSVARENARAMYGV